MTDAAGGATPDELRAAHERLESELREARESLENERTLRIELERSRQAERARNRDLRTEIMQMHHEAHSLEDSDIRAMVLHVAITLMDSEKGLLLARREPSDGGEGFELVCAEGFESDPTDSAVASRFAAEVIERDSSVREDNWRAIQVGRRTAADEEIQNLVAIPIYIQDALTGVVVCANRKDAFHDYDEHILLSLGDHAGAVLENSRLHRKLRSSYLATVRMLSEAIDAKDPFLRSHSEEVSSYVAAVADRLGLPPARREELVFGSVLHDVGKIGISERILLKPASLTAEELGIVQMHTRIGFRLVQQIPSLRPIAPAILHHHERFDGDGYPGRLRGEKIPLEARIICVADSFSAMVGERPYSERMSVAEACAELERCAGSQFDPEIVRIFVEEVWRRPPLDEEQALVAALDEPELIRGGDEPVLGHSLYAVTDNLTLLYSHRYFHDVADAHARRAASEERPFVVVLVEVEDLAELNRRSGYGAGDTAIQAAGRAVQRVGVQSGGTPCRYSGRRLGLIVADAYEEDGERLAERIVADLADGPQVRTAVAEWQPGDSGDEVIARARMRFALDGVRASSK